MTQKLKKMEKTRAFQADRENISDWLARFETKCRLLKVEEDQKAD